MANNIDVRNIRVLAFLDAYEKQECLWNPALDSYKNKADRDRAYLKIIHDLNIPSLTAHDVKLKVKGIRTTYAKELRFLNKHKEQGKSYKPKLFWFNRANSFLRNVCVSRHRKTFFSKEDEATTNPIEIKDCTFEYVSDVGSTDDVTQNEPNEDETNNIIESTSTHSNEVSMDFKFGQIVDQTDTHIEYQPEEAPAMQSFFDTARTEDSPAPASKKRIEPVNWKDDEFELFCRSVAAQLRSIPDSYSRSVAKLKIQQILFEAETGHYRNTPCITIPVAHS